MVNIHNLFQTDSKLPVQDEQSVYAATDRQSQLTKPQGSLGRLEEIAIFMAGWQGKEKPTISNGYCLVFAGNHGITAKGVSLFPAGLVHFYLNLRFVRLTLIFNSLSCSHIITTLLDHPLILLIFPGVYRLSR